MNTHHTSGAADLPEALDAIADSQYLAGVTAGWNAAQANDPNAALRKIHESRAGYLKPLRDAKVAALAAGQAVAPVVDDKTAGHAMLWRQHCDKLDALVTYCPTCCQGFIAQKEMTRDQIIYECGKTAGRAALPAPPAMDGGDAVDAARWRMLPAFFEEYQIDAMKLYRDIDAARAAEKENL